jgi:hypothetical protein
VRVSESQPVGGGLSFSYWVEFGLKMLFHFSGVIGNSSLCLRERRGALDAPFQITLGRRNQKAGKFELPAHPGVIIKDSYWRWPQQELAGNTIDFSGPWPDLPQRHARHALITAT